MGPNRVRSDDLWDEHAKHQREGKNSPYLQKTPESWVTCNHSNTEYQVVSRCNLIGLQFNQCSFTLPNTCGAIWRRCFRLHNPFCGPTPAAKTGESEKKKKEEEKKKKRSQDGPYHTPLNATRNATRPPRRSMHPLSRGLMSPLLFQPWQ